jgi:hypothetical protein
MATGTCKTCGVSIFKFPGRPGWFEQQLHEITQENKHAYKRHTAERCRAAQPDDG